MCSTDNEVMEWSDTDLPNLDIEEQKASSVLLTDKPDITGRRIVDIQHLFASLKSLKHNGFGCSFFDIYIVGEKRVGLNSIFFTKCQVCNVKNKFTTEPHDSVDINKAAVCGILAIGAGYSQFSELFSSLNIPSMSSHTYYNKEQSVNDNIKETAWEEMKKAGKEEAILAKEAGDVDVDGIPVMTVIVAGAWGKRSYKNNYSSLSGVACIMGARTKKILHLGVKNKYCSVCKKSASSLTKEKRQHRCFKNWNNTSTSMESAIIVEGFRTSLSMHGLKYGKIIGDGDSSVYRKVCEAKPYGPNFFIEKIQCRNHILRNYLNKIRELLKYSKVNPIVKNFLKQNIFRFRSAVTNAIKFRKQEDVPIQE